MLWPELSFRLFDHVVRYLCCTEKQVDQTLMCLVIFHGGCRKPDAHRFKPEEGLFKSQQASLV